MSNILDNILATKKLEIASSRQKKSIANLEDEITSNEDEREDSLQQSAKKLKLTILL